MRDQTQSTPVDPHTCFFTRTALLTLPPEWRIPMVHIGQALYEIGLEIYGIAPETRDGYLSTCHQLVGFAGDLRIVGDQLAALAQEPEGADLSDAESRLCKLAGRLAPKVAEISRTLMDAGRGIRPDGGRAL
jgi:hypothetical protein